MDTTDNLQEIFDIVDADDNVVGQAARKTCNSHPQLIHRAVFILIYNDRDQILWQKRSLTKDVGPGQWVTSASGHVGAGDDYEAAARREVKEELGIDVPLEYLGKFLYRYRNENEYSAVFRARSNGPFPFNRTEIAEVRFMTVAEILIKDAEKELKLSRAAHYIIDSLALR
jgi:isopentenyl-diphosphate delta-isomerase type 1